MTAGTGRRGRLIRRGSIALLAVAGLMLAAGARAQQDTMVQLDFNDVELSVVIETIAKQTGRNFIYDDRVRGRVTIVSPSPMTLDQAYAVFESVLQVKGFTTVEGPGGALKVIPIREAKESNIETSESTRRPPNRDRFITRLVPLQYIDAEDITNTLKPLVSKDASMVAYAPTNTMILTDSASNIRRILSILDSIDVETYREELAVIQVEYADAATLASQLVEIFGGEAAGTATPASAAARARARRTAAAAATTSPGKTPPRIITDSRTNSLIVLASRGRLDEIRSMVARLDVPVTGQGRINVYYLKHADAEELSETLNSLISGQPRSATAARPGQVAAQTAQALRGAITELADSVTITADVATNAILVQGSKEAYATLLEVIEKLDIERPQVLVEALIMEVTVTDSQDLGFNAIVELVGGGTGSSLVLQSATDAAAAAAPAFAGGPLGMIAAAPTITEFFTDTRQAAVDEDGNTVIDPDTGEVIRTGGGTIIQGIITAAAATGDANILSAPHILTSDNEEAEIEIGDNIPIVTSRVQSAAGVDQATDSLATSQNIERRDIGVTLRVTPQISEGDTLRLEIFQEITAVNSALSAIAGFNADEVGVALSNRKVENTVVVGDGETVVIGGLIGDEFSDNVSKVPFLGDIPLIGWLFKTTSLSVQKQNLLVFLTPHIIRKKEDLEFQTIRKREEFRRNVGASLERDEDEEPPELDEYGLPLKGETSSRNPARNRLDILEARYPLERMLEIEKQKQNGAAAEPETSREPALRYVVVAGIFRDDQAATEALTELLDAGYEGQLVTSADQGKLIFEVRVGPFESYDEAARTAETLGAAHGLEPAVMVERTAGGDPADGEDAP